MKTITEINVGEFKVTFEEPTVGKVTLEELGFSDEQLQVDGGNLRLVFELGGEKQFHFYQVPTIEIFYHEKIGKSGWQVEFNGEVVSEKSDPSGHSTIMLLNRKKLQSLKHRHINEMIVRADLPETVHLSAARSFVHLFDREAHD